jgi:hypothetical protein
MINLILVRNETMTSLYTRHKFDSMNILKLPKTAKLHDISSYFVKMVSSI